MNIYGQYFYGNKISEYGLEHNRVDYATLAKSFDAVLNNGILEATYNIGIWEMESGFIDNSEEIEEVEEKIEEIENRLAMLEEEAEEREDIIEELTQRLDVLEDKNRS